jgi:hypothetical protein
LAKRFHDNDTAVAGDDNDLAKRSGDIADDLWMVSYRRFRATSARSLGPNVVFLPGHSFGSRGH